MPTTHTQQQRPRLPTRWQRLPRDARDTLFLLGVIAWTVLPHLAQLPWWCGVLTGGVLLWRARLAVANARLPSRWWVAALLVLSVVLTFVSFKTILGKEPGITMVVTLMALKTLELRARRDAFVVFFLGFFIVLTHFLYSQSILVAAAMLVSVWGLLTGLVLAHMPVGTPSLRRAGALALRTALLGAPVMALLFVLFPRIGPLWGVPQDDRARTGLSGSMQMGSVAELAQDDTIVMRVSFEGKPPPPETLYFRGPVLTRFDGRTWTAAFSQAAPPAEELRTEGPALRYQVTLEPLRLPLLPALDATDRIDEIEGLRSWRRSDLMWATERPLFERVRYSASAHTRFAFGPTQRSGTLRDALALPNGHAPRTRAWARELGEQPQLATADARTLAAAVMGHIRNAGYTYTLAPGTYGDADARTALDEFWLDRKEGFCEHFAAAFVVIMRTLDVPARIVTGYQGTDTLPVDGYYVVRQSFAHAWAEYWQEGVGWLRADPTAAVAPDRISRSVSLGPAPGLVAGTISRFNPELLLQLRGAWEALNNRWNQTVLNYSRGNQLDLLKRLGYDAPSWEDLGLLLVFTLSGLSFAVALWAWWDKQRQDPWQRQSLAVKHSLQRLGVAASPHDPPRRLATRIEQRFGAKGAALAALLHELERQRYAPGATARPSSRWLRAWRKAVRLLAQARPT